MNERKPRLMVISQAFAPYTSGSAVLMANLLQEYPGDCLAIGGYSRYTKHDPNFKSPCPVVYLKPPQNKLFELGYARFINNNRWFVRSFFLKQIKAYRPDAILAAFPHSVFFIAAFEVAQKCGIPFYAHMHDLWQENYPEGYYARRLADKYEELILKKATRVYCMTETQAAHYERKYSIKPLILPHTTSKLNLQQLHYSPVRGDDKKILFAGAVSELMNADALAVLSRSRKFIRHANLSFNFFTPASEAELISKGVEPSGINLKWVNREQLQEEQRTSNILFAPLSHKNCSELEVKTVFSTKLLEYLVAGRPILLFAPPDSFHAISARRNNWAFVVDKDSEESLAAGIDRLLEDEELCRKIVQGAFREAKEREASIFARRLYQHVVEDATRIQEAAPV